MSDKHDFFLKLLQRAIQKDASDIHIKTGSAPYYRVDGYLEPQEGDTLKAADIEVILDILLSDEQKKFLQKKGEVDLAFTERGVGRFRINVFRQRGTFSLVMRRIKTKTLTFEQLMLPPAVEKLTLLARGLVLITGTTGSGKSTTLATIVDYINSKRRCHIVTIEDPIEYIHQDKKAVVNQREINIDTADFSSALKAVMRQDPDVILVGEMRDLETFQAAISATETGHLVFSTLHTTNAMQTIDRIIDLFPSNQHDQVRSQLALNLKAVLCQRLIQRADGTGRIPACELMFVSPAIQKLIKENRVMQIPTAIMQGADDGMLSFNESLHSIVQKRLITLDDAMAVSDNPEELKMIMQGIRLSSQKGGLLGG